MILTDVQFSRSLLPLSVSLQVTGWLVLSVVELVAFLNFVNVQNLYVQISVSRFLEVVVCVELVAGLSELLAVSLTGVGKASSSSFQTSSLLLFLLVFVFWLVHLEKVPFDVVEAESELIDGVTTEFEGYAFSLVYAAEVVSGFVLLKLFSPDFGFSLLLLSGLFLATFVGRILLARMQIVDVVNVSLSVGLVATSALVAISRFYSEHLRKLWKSSYRTSLQDLRQATDVIPRRTAMLGKRGVIAIFLLVTHRCSSD